MGSLSAGTGFSSWASQTASEAMPVQGLSFIISQTDIRAQAYKFRFTLSMSEGREKLKPPDF